MSISKIFQQLKNSGEGALIAYITGGDPEPKYSPQIIEALVRGGADIIEIGVPFSDPIADGPIIQAADTRALKAGTTPYTIFEIVKESKKRVEVPIVLLTYYNIIFKMGVRNFLENASKHNVNGLIIPDLPIEEAGEYYEIAEKFGIDTIFLATPSTSTSRLVHIIRFTSGFLYLISVFGVTGTREKMSQRTIDTIQRFKPLLVDATPLAVGFGISKPEHVRSLIHTRADAAIVGSAFVKLIEQNLDNSAKIIGDIELLAQALKSATRLDTSKNHEAKKS